jgi:hypothetical protein
MAEDTDALRALQLDLCHIGQSVSKGDKMPWRAPLGRSRGPICTLRLKSGDTYSEPFLSIRSVRTKAYLLHQAGRSAVFGAVLF